MKARLIKDVKGELVLLCKDGTIADASKANLIALLKEFKCAANISGDENRRWDNGYPDMGMYPGTEYAMVTDTDQLVLTYFEPFEDIFKVEIEPTNLLTASEYGDLHGKSVEQVKVYCRSGRILGAVKMGRNWMIPADARYPADGRLKL